MKHFLAVDPHVENINLYHAYFERLLKMMSKSLRGLRKDLVLVFEEEQQKHGFVGELMKHAHKFAIVSCFCEILTLDLADPTLSVGLDLK
jgi:hypothetical protein